MSIIFRPRGSYVLVRREPLPEQSLSGLYILGRDYPTIGTVLAVGPGPWRKEHYYIRAKETKYGAAHAERKVRWFREPLDLSPGDWVQWSPGFSYDLAQIGLHPDVLLLHYDQLNLRGKKIRA